LMKSSKIRIGRFSAVASKAVTSIVVTINFESISDRDWLVSTVQSKPEIPRIHLL